MSTATPTTLLEFLSSVPAPVTSFLVTFGPVIAVASRFGHALSWRKPATWDESWLILFSWWAICIITAPILKYLLPFVVFAPTAFRRIRAIYPSQRVLRSKQLPPPTTEQVLATSISNLEAIHALAPRITFTLELPPLPWKRYARIIGIVYVPYLIITLTVPLKFIVACAGSVVLTWRAPWAEAMRTALGRSAIVRASVAKLYSLISGEQIRSENVLAIAAETNVKRSERRHRFLFEILENQRWWMGLDWTAALLPNERPSWSTTLTLPSQQSLAVIHANGGSESARHDTPQFAFQPLPPPAAFPLPESTTVYLKPFGAGRTLKMTARWQWEDEEWGIVLRKEGDGPSKRRVQAPPSQSSQARASLTKVLQSTSSADSSENSTLTKAISKLRGRSSTNSTEPPTFSPASSDTPLTGHLEDEEADGGEDPHTDADGWIYGDNKWEGASCKGGIGKFTRYRRWTRIAVCVETEEEVNDADAPPMNKKQTASDASESGPSPAAPIISKEKDGDRRGGDAESDVNSLRRRLQAAVTAA